jgi:glutamyl-tRNA reductase
VNLVVIGLNHKTAPVEIREKFWLSESRRVEALQALAHSRGIEEAVVLATCNRTEFLLWADEIPAAIESTKTFLAQSFGLEASEWNCFYCRVGGEALAHIFRVTSSLDSMVVGEPEITGQVKSAWAMAQQAGTTGRFLDAVLQKALNVSKRARNETAIGEAPVSVPYAAVELARQIFGRLDGRKVLVLGTGKMGELSARNLLSKGATAVWVTNRTYEHALTLAKDLGGEAIPFEDRWQHLADADIVISSTGCPHFLLKKEDAERIHQKRAGRPVFLIDIAVPRDIDPEVRKVPGVFLYDIDDLERVVARNLSQRHAAAVEAEKLVLKEAQGFREKLLAERIVPTIVALRRRLEEIRTAEMERFRAEAGPLSVAEEQAVEALTAQIVGRIAGQLARELKHVPERPEQEALAAAVERLFGLSDGVAPAQRPRYNTPQTVLAETN